MTRPLVDFLGRGVETLRDGGWVSMIHPDDAADVAPRIRALFKQTAPAKELLDVNEVVAEVRRLMLDDLRRKKIDVELELGEALPPAPADRMQVQQVLVNLMHNGADAMESVSDRPRALMVRTWRVGRRRGLRQRGRVAGREESLRAVLQHERERHGRRPCHLPFRRRGSRRQNPAENREHRGAAFTFTLPAHTGGAS